PSPSSSAESGAGCPGSAAACVVRRARGPDGGDTRGGSLPQDPPAAKDVLMSRSRSLTRALTGAAVLIASLLAGAPTAHAATGGTLVGTILDQSGHGSSTFVEAYASDGTAYTTDGLYSGSGTAPPPGVTQTFTLLPAGTYSLKGTGPWTGVTCAGV